MQNGRHLKDVTSMKLGCFHFLLVLTSSQSVDVRSIDSGSSSLLQNTSEEIFFTDDDQVNFRAVRGVVAKFCRETIYRKLNLQSTKCHYISPKASSLRAAANQCFTHLKILNLKHKTIRVFNILLRHNTSTNFASASRNVAIPLLDIGELLVEDRLRTKRNNHQRAIKGCVVITQTPSPQGKEKDKHAQPDPRDAFVDSLVSMMSKSDPGLLLKLKDRIEEFQRDHTKRTRLVKQNDRRPLIQFFNVTKISVASPDDNDEKAIQLKRTGHTDEDDVLLSDESDSQKNEDEDDVEDSDEIGKVTSINEPELESGFKKDLTTLLKTKDGHIARIQRSKDRRRYRLEIDYTTVSSKKGKDRDRPARIQREVKASNELQNLGPETYFGFWQGIIGSKTKETHIQHSYGISKGPSISITI